MLISAFLWATQQPDFDTARKAADQITFEAIEDESERSRWMEEYEWPSWGAGQGEFEEEKAEALERLRADLHSTIDEIEAMWRGRSSRSDYDWHEMGPVTVIWTGGESYGDDPDGDAYRHVVTMQTFGLDTAAGFYR